MRSETTPASRALVRVARTALGLLLFCQSLPAAAPAQAPKVKPAAPAPAQKKASLAPGQRVASAPAAARSKARVNLKKLARQAASAPRKTSAPARLRHIPAPLSIREPARPSALGALNNVVAAADLVGPSAPSPSPSQSFLAQEDAPQAGTGIYTIPPDTMGAVGLDKIFVNLNNNYRVQNKTTGAALSTVAPDAFWSAVGAEGVFDPRVLYDPYNHRWILAAVSHSPDPSNQAATYGQSSVLVGVSETSDPEGDFFLFRFVVGCNVNAPGCEPDGEWADFPMLGFNKNWVAVSWNQFTITSNFPVGGGVLALDYAALRAGTATASRVTIPASLTEGAFCMYPATTLSPTEPTLYFVSHVNSFNATYRVFNMSGALASPTLTAGAVKVRDVHGQGNWEQPFGDILPQKCVAGASLPTQGCPGTTQRIEAGDSYVRSNVVFRGGKLYYPQTVSLPAEVFPPNSRTGAQWTVLDAATHEDVDGGRVYDPEATAANGGSWYAYPSLAVNRHGDILLGFSEFESDDYVDAGYALRLSTDDPGTMREPVIYKEGEDYYEKTFGGGRNRWGDYSHTVVDPSNDRDLWTIQEYARPRVGVTGMNANDSRWGTWWAKVSMPAGPGDLVISEFRLHGPAGANDEFVEIFNASGTELRVATADGSAGYALVASDGAARFTIPNGTVIPARGHFLGANSAGYSLGSHPSGAGGSTAAGDALYAADIPTNAGLALFRTADPGGFTPANRLDAVGSTAVSDALYREGAGLPPITPPASNHSFLRSFCPGNAPISGSSLGCVLGGSGLPRDTNANEKDFIFVDTEGTNAGAGRRLGAPGPENLSSPVERNAGFTSFPLDATMGAAAPPNRLRVQTPDPANNSAVGTMELRRRFVNNTAQNVTRLRFRIADLTTFPPSSSFADLRARTSGAVTVNGVADPATCSPLNAPCTVTVRGTSLDTPPAQPAGGGFNSALTVALPAPLAPGASVNVRFLFGVQKTGNFRFYINVEALP